MATPNLFYGIVAALFTMFGAYWVAPQLIAYLGVPLCRRSVAHQEDGDTAGERLLAHCVALYVLYVAGAGIFVFTGGALGKILNFTEQGPASLLLSGLTGTLFVAMARTQAIRHSNAMVSGFQQLVIGALAATALLLGAGGLTWSQVQAVIEKLGWDTIRSLLFLPILVGGTVECLHLLLSRYGNARFRTVSYDLIRHRIESSEPVEQVWSPWAIDPWAAKTLNNIINREGMLELLWITVSLPDFALRAICACAEERQMSDQALIERVSIVIPESELGRLPEEWRNENRLFRIGCVRKLPKRLPPPRSRFMVINKGRAMLFFPMRFEAGNPHQASDHAALVTDPSRVQEYRDRALAIWDLSQDL